MSFIARIIKPKHTVLSVATQIQEGLRSGSVTLDMPQQQNIPAEVLQQCVAVCREFGILKEFVRRTDLIGPELISWSRRGRLMIYLAGWNESGPIPTPDELISHPQVYGEYRAPPLFRRMPVLSTFRGELFVSGWWLKSLRGLYKKTTDEQKERAVRETELFYELCPWLKHDEEIAGGGKDVDSRLG